jgi:hypothetical protein
MEIRMLELTDEEKLEIMLNLLDCLEFDEV